MSWLPLRVVPRRAWPNAPPQCWNPEGRHMEEFVRHFEHFEYSKTSWKMVIVKSKRKPIQRFRTYHDISTWSRIFLPKKENLTLLYNHLVVWGAMTGTPSPTLQPSVPRSVFTPTAFSAKQLAQKKNPTNRFYLFHSCAHCALSHLYTKSIQTARFYTKPENPTSWSLENLWVTLMLTSRHHDTSRITSINKVSRRIQNLKLRERVFSTGQPHVLFRLTCAVGALVLPASLWNPYLRILAPNSRNYNNLQIISDY
jgi:hypothetical protein